MAFRKYMKSEAVSGILKRDQGNRIRKLVKQAGKKSASELTDEQRRQLPR